MWFANPARPHPLVWKKECFSLWLPCAVPPVFPAFPCGLPALCYSLPCLLQSFALAVFLGLPRFFGLPNFFPWLAILLGLAMVTASAAPAVLLLTTSASIVGISAAFRLFVCALTYTTSAVFGALFANVAASSFGSIQPFRDFPANKAQPPNFSQK